MGKPVDVSATDFEAEVLQVEGTPVLVDFWSETCGHCLALNPQFEQAAEETGDRVKFAKVTFSDNKDIFKEYSVRATPTLVLFRDGEEIARTVGAKRADEVKAWVDEQLAG